jgi:hypothetical protein
MFMIRMKLEFVRPLGALKVPVGTVMMKSNLFIDDLMLTGPVSVDDFHQFVSVVGNQDVEVTNANIGGLSLLCDEFRFEALSERLSASFKEC